MRPARRSAVAPGVARLQKNSARRGWPSRPDWARRCDTRSRAFLPDFVGPASIRRVISVRCSAGDVIQQKPSMRLPPSARPIQSGLHPRQAPAVRRPAPARGPSRRAFDRRCITWENARKASRACHRAGRRNAGYQPLVPDDALRIVANFDLELISRAPFRRCLRPRQGWHSGNCYSGCGCDYLMRSHPIALSDLSSS